MDMSRMSRGHGRARMQHHAQTYIPAAASFCCSTRRSRSNDASPPGVVSFTPFSAVSGKFTGAQRDFYGHVLEAHSECLRVRPLSSRGVRPAQHAPQSCRSLATGRSRLPMIVSAFPIPAAERARGRCTEGYPRPVRGDFVEGYRIPGPDQKHDGGCGGEGWVPALLPAQRWALAWVGHPRHPRVRIFSCCATQAGGVHGRDGVRGDGLSRSAP